MDNNQNPLENPQENPIPQEAEEIRADETAEETTPMPENVADSSENADTDAPETPAEQPAKKWNLASLKPFIFGAIAAIILLIAVVCIWPKGNNYVAPERSIMLRYDEEKEKTLIFVDGKKIETTIDGDYYTYSCSIDGKVAAILTDTEDRILYLFDGKDLIKVSDKVGSFGLADSGASVAYTTIEEDGEGALMLFNAKKEKAEKITDELYGEYCLSPDGKSIAFAEGKDDGYSLYVTVNGEKTKIKSDALPLGLSNKAKLVYYYVKEDSSIYVYKKEEATKIISGATGDVIFNIDHTEILFYSNRDVYISQDGNEKVKISSKGISGLGSYDIMNNSFENGDSVVLPIKTFEKTLFTTGKTEQNEKRKLYYLDSKLEKIEVADDVESFDTSLDGGVIYYLNSNDELFRMKNYKADAEEIADDVYDFEMTSDGKACYFIEETGTGDNTEKTLYYAKKTSDPKKIADDVNSLYMTYDDYCLFVADRSETKYTGTLYSSRGGSEKVKVADDVNSCYIRTTATYYSQRVDDETTALYGTAKKTKFEKLAEYK